MKTCKRCGKPINKAFELCYNCNMDDIARRSLEAYDRMTPQEREDEREAYYNSECTMCGKEGADYRSDGKPYCSHCWTVWNS